MRHLVFVYGTLRKGEAHHDHLENDARLIAEQAWTNGRLFQTDKHYPALVASDDHRVYGELYEVNDEQLAFLDDLEGYHGDGEDNLYDRRIQKVFTDDKSCLALVYHLNLSHNQILKEPDMFGDWKVSEVLRNNEIHLYFAYGSCMDNDRFIKAGVDHHFNKMIGRGTLDGYSLKFARKGIEGGAADIVEVGGQVEGKVYEIERDALDYLFDREGVNHSIYRPAIITVEIDGKQIENVLTFIVISKDEESAPTAIYATEILRGGNGTLSSTYLSALRQRIKADFDMDILD